MNSSDKISEFARGRVLALGASVIGAIVAYVVAAFTMAISGYLTSEGSFGSHLMISLFFELFSSFFRWLLLVAPAVVIIGSWTGFWRTWIAASIGGAGCAYATWYVVQETFPNYERSETSLFAYAAFVGGALNFLAVALHYRGEMRKKAVKESLVPTSSDTLRQG